MAQYDRGFSNRPFTNLPGGGRYEPSGGASANEELPDGYLDGGYYKEVNGEKVLKKEYIVKYPTEIVELLKVRDDKGRVKPDINKRSQIRKFYEYALAAQGLLQRNGNRFEVVEAELNRLIPFADYAKSRGTVSGLFVEFIKKNVTSIHNTSDMTAFIKHFEAIVAYLPKDKG